MSGPQEPFPLGGSAEDDETARLLRRALEREAQTVTPSEDGLAGIVERTREGGGRRWVPWVAAAAAVVVVGGVTGLTLLDGDGGTVAPAASGTTQGVTGPTGSTGPTETDEAGGTASAPVAPPATDPDTGAGDPSSVPEDTAAGGEVSGVPVYWVGETAVSYRLFREFRTVPDVGSRVASAVSAMTTQQPADPDYATPWSPASRVEASVSGDAVTVDLSADAFAAGVGSELADLAVQQLVYTATAAAQVPGSVTVTVDGEPYDAWGSVPLGEPMTRQPMVDVQNPTWLLTPVQGATVDAGTVRFTGLGTAFEGTFGWEVRDSGGAVVAEGFADGGANGTFDALSFTTDLSPGDYTVEVWQPDASGGESPEGPRMFPDSKAFTVS